MSPMIPTELLHVIRPRRRYTDSEITVTTAFHRMFPILAHSAAHRRPAGYTFCSCFLFIFLQFLSAQLPRNLPDQSSPNFQGWQNGHVTIWWPCYNQAYYFASAAVAVDSSHMTLRRHPLRGVDSVRHLQIVLTGTCRRRGSWSVAGHDHMKVIGRAVQVSTTWALDLSRHGSSETMCDDGDRYYNESV